MAEAFELWGQRGRAYFEVVGESFYEKQIKALFKDTKLRADGGTELAIVVELRPDPLNRYDPHAVGVWGTTGQLGSLSRDEAKKYQPVLLQLVKAGYTPVVGARAYGSEYEDYDGRKKFRGGVWLDLAEPHMLFPLNAPPRDGAHQVLPLGAAIQVTGEDKHLDALIPHLRPEGEGWVHATLHPITEQTARSTKDLVEVRIDGHRVGQLTPKMSGDLLPAITHLAASGTTAATRAVVKGNRLKAEVVLYVQRAHELPASWLDARPAAVAVAAPPRAHVPVPPRPTGLRFVVPPEWPQPPAGWEPQTGWQTDPAWPAAPAGWQYWQLTWSQAE
ncbi:HIRAN domain-containing protein [Paractinoplanes atraurantiacus]|uniref:HIRAN domain-containing protein n=1 Tax=Paractinoplanes atraurantiacus TaxID=1036182 RepID=UPI00117851E0|nr:HIRAN domain-containing protein [Actinoplanes atraurantiacus]